MRNNPVRYTDPTGHMQYCGDGCGMPGSYDCSSDAAPTDSGSPQPAASTGDNQGPSGDEGGEDRGGGGRAPMASRWYEAGDSCHGVGCFTQSDNWFSSNQTGSLFGVNFSVKAPTTVLPPWAGLGTSGGLEYVQNTPWGQPYDSEGLFGYLGPSATFGASVNADVYIGGVFNYASTPGTGQDLLVKARAYAGPATSYQGNISLGSLGIAVSDTVADTDGSPNWPLARGVPQTITIGYAPGVGVGISYTRVNEILIVGKDFR